MTPGTYTAIEPRIERRLNTNLGFTTDTRPPEVQRAIDSCEDRWYGRVLATTFESAAGSDVTDPVLSASAGIELLRSYCRLRSDHLVEGSVDGELRTTRETTDDLLSGDYLLETAHSAIGDMDHPTSERCFEVLADVTMNVAESLASHQTTSGTESRDLLEGVAGSLGEGAAVIGATLGGVAESHRNRFGTLGRDLAVLYAVRSVLDADTDTTPFVDPSATTGLYRDAKHRLERTHRSLVDLSPIADVALFRPFIDEIDPSDIGSSTR